MMHEGNSIAASGRNLKCCLLAGNFYFKLRPLEYLVVGSGDNRKTTEVSTLNLFFDYLWKKRYYTISLRI